MGQILHKRATTTEEIRNKIKQEKGTTDSIAKKYNISWNTAKKWQSRDNAINKYKPNTQCLMFHSDQGFSIHLRLLLIIVVKITLLKTSAEKATTSIM